MDNPNKQIKHIETLFVYETCPARFKIKIIYTDDTTKIVTGVGEEEYRQYRNIPGHINVYPHSM